MSNLDIDPNQDFPASPPALEPEPAVPQKQAAKGFGMSDGGLMTLQTVAEQRAFAKRLIDEKMISSSFKTAEQVIIGIQYSKAMKLEPIVALRMMYIVNGKPNLFGEGPLALCQRAGAVKDIVEFFVDEDGKRISFGNGNLRTLVFGAVTQIWRVSQEQMQEDSFTLDDMKRAGIDIDAYKGKRKDVWVKFERNMMRYKARSMSLKTKFGDLIAGIPIAEHDENFSPEFPDMVASKEQTAADRLNEAYLDKSEEKPAEKVV